MAEPCAFRPDEMASLLEALARKAERHDVHSYSEWAHIARQAALCIKELSAPSLTTQDRSR